MTVSDGCNSSLEFEWKRVKKSKLPPGGGRAAEGGSECPTGDETRDSGGNMPRGTRWVAVTYLGGAECKFRLQCGKRVEYVHGGVMVGEALARALGLTRY